MSDLVPTDRLRTERRDISSHQWNRANIQISRTMIAYWRNQKTLLHQVCFKTRTPISLAMMWVGLCINLGTNLLHSRLLQRVWNPQISTRKSMRTSILSSSLRIWNRTEGMESTPVSQVIDPLTDHNQWRSIDPRKARKLINESRLIRRLWWLLQTCSKTLNPSGMILNSELLTILTPRSLHLLRIIYPWDSLSSQMTKTCSLRIVILILVCIEISKLQKLWVCRTKSS